MSSPSIFTGNLASGSRRPFRWRRCGSRTPRRATGRPAWCRAGRPGPADRRRAGRSRPEHGSRHPRCRWRRFRLPPGLHDRSGGQLGERTDFHKGHSLLSTVYSSSLRRAGACAWAFCGAWEAEWDGRASPCRPAPGRSPGRPSSDQNPFGLNLGLAGLRFMVHSGCKEAVC